VGDFARVPAPEDNLLAPYAGRWVAYLGGRVVAQGGTPQQALRGAKSARFKEKPEVFYVPTATPFRFSPILAQVRRALPDDKEVYLVGGAVRDALLARQSHDFDFTLGEGALHAARTVANKFGAAFFPLDEARDTGRVIFTDESGFRQILDFAALRGQDLTEDLMDRDFTVNAMAVNLRDPQALLDPLGGAADLQAAHALHLDEAHPAHADRLHALVVAEPRHVGLVPIRNRDQHLPFARGDRLAVDLDGNCVVAH